MFTLLHHPPTPHEIGGVDYFPTSQTLRAQKGLFVMLHKHAFVFGNPNKLHIIALSIFTFQGAEDFRAYTIVNLQGLATLSRVLRVAYLARGYPLICESRLT